MPNLELAHHPFRKGKTYEDNLGAAALKKVGKKKWNQRLGQAIETLDRVMNYDRLYLGGGNGKKVTIKLPSNVAIVSNVAGLLGGIALWSNGQPKKSLSPARSKTPSTRKSSPSTRKSKV